MGKIDQITAAIEQLSTEDVARLRAWLDAHEAQAFDDAIERDAKAGKLDQLAAKALVDHAAGRSREL
jgi:hypothetical protein